MGWGLKKILLYSANLKENWGLIAFQREFEIIEYFFWEFLFLVPK
jgi:hypothetical protein